MSAKIRRSLIILVIVLVLLLAAAAAAFIIPKLGKDTAKDTPLLTVEAPVKVAFGAGENVNEFILDGEVWRYADNTSYPIKQTGITRIINTVPKVTAVRTIDANDSLSAFGLEPVEYTLTLTGADGKTETLYIGSSVGENECYAKLAGSDTIYTIAGNTNIVSFVASTLYAMLDPELPPSMGENAISEMTVEYGGKSASFKHDEEDGWRYLTENGEYVAEEDYSAVGSDGESHTARKYLNDVGDAIPDFKSKSCRGYDPTEAELSEMGFDKPLTVKVTKTDGTYMVYHVGETLTDTSGKEYNYFIVEGNPALFCMESATVLPFIELVNVLGR